MKKTVEEGVYRDMSNEVYHQKNGYYSSSVLKGALKGASYFFDTYVQGTGPDMSKNEAALHLGNYLHIALLEPENLESECVVYPAATRSGKKWKLFKNDPENAGKTIITMNELDKAADLIDSYNKSVVDLDGDEMEPAKGLFTGGDAEFSLFTELEGMPVKVRADYIIDKGDYMLIRDLKTTSRECNSAYQGQYVCNMFNYFLSGALYVDAFAKHYGKPCKFQLVFLSKSDYNVNVFEIGEESIEKGRTDYKKALECIKKWQKIGYRTGLRYV